MAFCLFPFFLIMIFFAFSRKNSIFAETNKQNTEINGIQQ